MSSPSLLSSIAQLTSTVRPLGSSPVPIAPSALPIALSAIPFTSILRIASGVVSSASGAVPIAPSALSSPLPIASSSLTSVSILPVIASGALTSSLGVSTSAASAITSAPSATARASSTLIAASSGVIAAAGTAAAANTPPPPPFKDGVIPYLFDVALLCVLGFFLFATLPRAIAHFRNKAEWGSGLFLRAGKPATPRHRPSLQQQSSGKFVEKHYRISSTDSIGDHAAGPFIFSEKPTVADSAESHPFSDTHSHHSRQSSGQFPAGGSVDGHTLVGHNSHYIAAGPHNDRKPLPASSLPVHAPSWPTLTYPVSTIFTKSFAPGTTYGQLLLMITYLIGIFMSAFYFRNPVTGPNRLGFFALSQIPVAFALSAKNNVPGTLLGVGYEKLNYLHRWVGVVAAISANVHGASHIFQYVADGTIGEEIKTPLLHWGITSLICFDLLWIFSIKFIRNNAYRLFIFSHIAGFVVLPVAVYHHQPVAALRYVVITGGIFVVDHILRLVKTHFATAVVRVLPEAGMTQVSVPRLTSGWRAGQHVRLRVLSSEMGILGWAESHPFTIASVSASTSGAGAEGLVLMCKRAGGWTGKLYDAAQRAGVNGIESADGQNAGRKMRVMIEGPYGGLGHTVLTSYSGAMIVAGGSGITFGLSAIQDLVQKATEGKARTKFIELVWIVQDRAALVPFIPQFNEMVYDCEAVLGVHLKLSVFHTRVVSQNADAAATAALMPLTPTVAVLPGRPPLAKLLSDLVERAAAVPGKRGVAVGVCGPTALAESVKGAARAVDWPRRAAAGGIEVHQEVFGW